MSAHTEALQQLVDIIDSAGLLNLSNGVQLGQTVWYVKAFDRLNYAREVLAAPAPDTETAVDATLDVTAELARVTAERDDFKAKLDVEWKQGIEISIRCGKAEGRVVELEAERLRLVSATGCHPAMLESEVGRLLEVETQVENQDLARQRESKAVARAEKAEKERDELLLKSVDALTAERKKVAALRSALEALVLPNRGMGFGGMDRRFAEERARAVLADPNLGTDWVPRSELELAQAERDEAVKSAAAMMRPELRRVAEATAIWCAEKWARDASDVADDLDAIVGPVMAAKELKLSPDTEAALLDVRAELEAAYQEKVRRVAEAVRKQAADDLRRVDPSFADRPNGQKSFAVAVVECVDLDAIVRVTR